MWFRRRKIKSKQPSEISKQDIEEKKIVEAKLAKEIRKHYISISNATTVICYNTNWNNKNLEKFWKKYRQNPEFLSLRGLDIVISMYKLAGDVNSYFDLHKKVFKRDVVEKISKRHFYQDAVDKIMTNYDNSCNQIIKKNHGFEGNSYFEKAQGCGFIQLYNNFRNRDWDYFVFNFVFNIYKYDVESFNRSGLNFSQSELKQLYKESEDELLFFTVQYGYAFLFMAYILMLRKYEVFIQNDIVLLVLEQIKSDNDDKMDIFQEFYLIYSSLYRSAYDEEYSYDEIATFIIKQENIEKRDMFLDCDYYKEDLNDFKKDKNFKKMLFNIDKVEFFNKHSKKDPYIKENRDYFYNELFDYLMIKCMDYLDDDEFLKILFCKEAYIDKFLRFGLF